MPPSASGWRRIGKGCEMVSGEWSVVRWELALDETHH
jgi:hypothetical protein